MNNEQTRALWEKGESQWNAWALEMLQRKERLEESGTWATDWFGEGQNQETQDWLAEARADFTGMEFAADANFANFVFPGPAAFEGAHFLGKADFASVHFAFTARFGGTRFDGDAILKQVKFYHVADFEDAAFASPADFERTEFLRDSTGPLVPAARFQKVQFGKRADFRGARFTGHAEFVRTQFGGNPRFDEAEFKADANFEGAVLEGTVGLMKTRFCGATKFDGAQFRSEARFGEVEFQKSASFEETAFAAKASFRLAQFQNETSFEAAHFADDVRFGEARFASLVSFRRARVDGNADFEQAAFVGEAEFEGARFRGDAHFEDAVFSRDANFPSVKFKDSASFSNATFHGAANFWQVTFKSRASFRQAVFEGAAVFSAVQACAAFVLAGSRFAQVPSFHVTSFREPPRFDHMTIADPLSLTPEFADKALGDPRPRLLRSMKICGDADLAARYRRLRQLATETQDNDRIQWFFAQETRCRRFWHDNPFGRGKARFWMGWAYGGVSDYGRSMIRPLMLWGASILLFTLVYLGMRTREYFTSAPDGIVAAGAPLFPTWPAHVTFWSVIQWVSGFLWWIVLSVFNLFSGGGCIAGDGRATGEAFFLSLKNSLFFLGWESPDAARRVYGCLYGFETQAGQALVRVPLGVSTTGVVQNVFGVVVIALFMLALRNLLRSR